MLGFNERELLLIQGADDVSGPTSKQGSLVRSALSPHIRHRINDVVGENGGVN